jgi:hypothetical protein
LLAVRVSRRKATTRQRPAGQAKAGLGAEGERLDLDRGDIGGGNCVLGGDDDPLDVEGGWLGIDRGGLDADDHLLGTDRGELGSDPRRSVYRSRVSGH